MALLQAQSINKSNSPSPHPLHVQLIMEVVDRITNGGFSVEEENEIVLSIIGQVREIRVRRIEALEEQANFLRKSLQIIERQ